MGTNGERGIPNQLVINTKALHDVPTIFLERTDGVLFQRTKD